MRWLYSLRDAAVHAKVVAEQFVAHPSGISLAEINRAYSAPEASRALALATDMIRSCLARPREANAGLVAWCDDDKRKALETALAPRTPGTPRAIIGPTST